MVPQTLRNLDLQNPGPVDLLQAAQILLTNTDGLITQRPWLISMLGLQYQFSGWFFSGQFLNEHIFNYSEPILQAQNYYYATLLTRKSFFRDKLSFSNFVRYNFDGQDFWINPELEYDLAGSVNLSLGSQLFGGAEPEAYYGHLSFQFYEQNSFVYTKIEAYF